MDSNQLRADIKTHNLLWELAHSIHRMDYYLYNVSQEQFESEQMRKDAVRCWLVHFSRCVNEISALYRGKYPKLSWDLYVPTSYPTMLTFEGEEIWEAVTDKEVSPLAEKLDWYAMCQIEINKLFQDVLKPTKKNRYEVITIEDIIGQPYNEEPILYNPPPIDQELGIRTINSIRPVRNRTLRRS
tara:strand:- start:1540 stop:2094 length:555 start_codon:yes stop_codon:yes gene_type:complete